MNKEELNLKCNDFISKYYIAYLEEVIANKLGKDSLIEAKNAINKNLQDELDKIYKSIKESIAKLDEVL